MADANMINPLKPSWRRTLGRVILICAGSVAILFPAWLPNQKNEPIERGTVELLQAALLAASAAVLLGALPHAGSNRAVCRMLSFFLLAAFVGEIEDFVSGILGWKFPEVWVIGILLLCALITAMRHRKVVVRFFGSMGNHAASGLVGAALLIIYVFDRVIGSRRFWKAALGDAFSPSVPTICVSYLELLACYLIFIGSIGFAITLARRSEGE
ncbi:hypothetical protein JIN85_08735 [Luteolibacter pohnpeiensis]|uniref:Uncharacterized protein n=1 Tax=Luteolibacter pohnpeiensis TaxID=454153 RepID=A0A934VWH1_9BACT|nr:hypothetical protein [Luteolibacter pohnpeiensis]MBK1882499.1 hypothetical protein [Luteolibacter pohnpeiensis]